MFILSLYDDSRKDPNMFVGSYGLYVCVCMYVYMHRYRTTDKSHGDTDKSGGEGCWMDGWIYQTISCNVILLDTDIHMDVYMRIFLVRPQNTHKL